MCDWDVLRLRKHRFNTLRVPGPDGMRERGQDLAHLGKQTPQRLVSVELSRQVPGDHAVAQVSAEPPKRLRRAILRQCHHPRVMGIALPAKEAGRAGGFDRNRELQDFI
jgi:hypothetical protein